MNSFTKSLSEGSEVYLPPPPPGPRGRGSVFTVILANFFRKNTDSFRFSGQSQQFVFVNLWTEFQLQSPRTNGATLGHIRPGWFF